MKNVKPAISVSNNPDYLHEQQFVCEDEYTPHDCYLCGERIESVHNSHHPFPLVNSNPSSKDENGKDHPKRCCNDCNELLVIPARIEMMVSRVA